MRVFLDANVFFSAADPASAVRALFDVVARHAVMVTSPHAIEEARRNILFKRPRFAGEIDRLVAAVEVSHALVSQIPASLPPEDVPILAGAMGSGATHLWTGDKRHFGPMFGKKRGDVLVVNAAMLLEICVERRWWKGTD